MANLSPIVLFVYNRPEHTKRTVESLLNNTLAGNSALFIFSDGAKSDRDEQKVKAIRDYIKAVKGFGKIEIVLREKNFGLANSIISGITEVFKQNDRVIVIEDDIISSPSFLTFMNKALEFYQSNENIFSVSGYPYSIEIPSSYRKDVFVSYRASSWGWGTWKDRWEKVDWKVKDFDRFVEDKNAQILFNRAGDDVTPMLKSQIWGEIDSWAIRWTYAHFKHSTYCLLPAHPFCKNIGTDKSGTHSSKTKKFDVTLSDNGGDLNLTNDLNPDPEIIKRIRKLVKPSPIRNIINKLKDYVY